MKTRGKVHISIYLQRVFWVQPDSMLALFLYIFILGGKGGGEDWHLKPIMYSPPIEMKRHFINALLSAFAKLRNATIRFVMSVRLSVGLHGTTRLLLKGFQ